MTSKRFVAALTASTLFGLLIAGGAQASNDGFFPKQWGLHQVKAEPSWPASSGAGRVIAVVDTGADFTHPELSGKSAGSFSCIGGSCKQHKGDDHGHGTMVSGIAAANTGNGLGIAGAAPAAKVLAVKVLGSKGSGSMSDVALGVRFAADKGASVINLSLGSDLPTVVADGPVGQFQQAVEYAWSKGAFVVAAAGNEGLLTSYSGIQQLFVVGATGAGDQPAYYSSSAGNLEIDLFAPGGDRGSADCSVETCIVTIAPGNGYVVGQGTSFSAPHIAGVAAQLMCLGLDNQATFDKLISSGDAMSDPPGARRLNAQAAVAGLSSASCSSAISSDPAPGNQGGAGSGKAGSRVGTGGRTGSSESGGGSGTPVSPGLPPVIAVPDAGEFLPSTEAVAPAEPSSPKWWLIVFAVGGAAGVVAGGYFGWFRKRREAP